MKELELKTERLVKLMAAENIDGILLNSQHNFAWLSGGGSNGVDLSRENGVALLLVLSDGSRFLLANNIEMPRMLAEEVSSDDFTPVEFSWQDEKSPGFLVRKIKEIVSNGFVGTDIIAGEGVVTIESKIAECRYELTPDEIERYRKLGNDSGSAIRQVIDNISPGETEIEIAEKMRHKFAVDNMACVVALVAADERIARFRHPVPTSKQWRKTLMLVACAKRGGLIVNLTRMICVGEVPDELKMKTEAATNVSARLHHATRPGAVNLELYEAAANAYAENGYSAEIGLHHQGGATGYRTRDWVAHPSGKDVVQLNQAFAWNPSITGTKVEETCLLTETGVECITDSPDFPRITTIVEGHEYFSPGVLSV